MANLNEKNLKERTYASLVLGSYLDTLGFNNGLWEFNFRQNLKIKDIPNAIIVTNEILSDFF